MHKVNFVLYQGNQSYTLKVSLFLFPIKMSLNLAGIAFVIYTIVVS